MAQENYFDVDQSAADRLNQGMNMGGGIELPFAAPVFWWMNGNPQNRALATSTPAIYFGGWAANADSIEEVADDRGGLPGGLVKTDIYTRDSNTVEAYTTRLLVVAPISFRQAWITGQQQTVRHVKYVQGGRQHIQVLCLTGYQLQDKTYQSWGPIVLSAKGYQAQYLMSAMKDWRKAIDRALGVIKANPKPPAWGFWGGIGTFGDKVDTQMVGKSTQSPITPINLFTPKELTAELLRRLYVGRDGVDEMAQLLDEASDWLNAWKSSDVAGAQTPGIEEDDYIPAGDPVEDIPF